MFNVSLVGDKELLAKFDGMSAQVRTALTVRVQELAIKLQTHIVNDKLHGQVLNQRTGALASSIQQESPITDGDRIMGRVFSAGDVKYAAFWEYGFHGIEHVNAHQRLTKDSDNPKGFLTVGSVSGYDRRVDQEARPFMRPALAEMASEIADGLRRAALQGAMDSLR